jgi:hypothetical protein
MLGRAYVVEHNGLEDVLELVAHLAPRTSEE